MTVTDGARCRSRGPRQVTVPSSIHYIIISNLSTQPRVSEQNVEAAKTIDAPNRIPPGYSNE